MNLYSVKETAEILKTTIQTVYKLKDSGLLKFIKIGSLKCPQEEIERFIRDNMGKDVSDPTNIKEI